MSGSIVYMFNKIAGQNNNITSINISYNNWPEEILSVTISKGVENQFNVSISLADGYALTPDVVSKRLEIEVILERGSSIISPPLFYEM